MKLIPPQGSFDRFGYTLIEMMVTFGVMATLLVTFGGLLASSQRSMNEIMGSAVVNETGKRALDRMVWELRFASPDSIKLAQPIDSRSISYKKVTGWAGSQAALSALQTISFNKGALLLNGTVVAGAVKDLVMNLNGRALTLEVVTEKDVNSAGSALTLSNTVSAQIRL